MCSAGANLRMRVYSVSGVRWRKVHTLMRQTVTLRFFQHRDKFSAVVARSDFMQLPELFSALSVDPPAMGDRPFTMVTLTSKRDFQLFAEQARSAARALDIDLFLSVASVTS